MKILNIELTRFKRLEVPGIKKLQIELDGKFQVVLGSNGSGKSSILNELLPSTPTKTLFPKGSSKFLRIEHNGDVFEVNYSNADGHSFVKNGENLNISKKNHIQSELINTYFGIDNLTRQILHGSLPLATMRPALRQATLVALNPINTQLFSDKKKAIHKQCSVFNNQISLLLKRQADIKTRLLPSEELAKIKKSMQELDSDEKILLVEMTKISSEIERLDVPTDPPSKEEALSLKSTAIALFREILSNSVRDSSSVLESVASSRVSISIREDQLSSLSDEISRLVSTINESETTIATLDSNSNYDKQLVALREQAEKYTIPAGSRFYSFAPRCFIPVGEINQVSNAVDKVVKLIASLTRFEYRSLMSKSTISDKMRELHTLEVEKSSLLQNLSSLRDNITRIEGEPIDSKPYSGECPKQQCGLFASFDIVARDRIARLDGVRASVATTEKSIKRVTVDIDDMHSFRVQALISMVLDEIMSIAEEYPVLFYLLDRDTIHLELNKSHKRFVEMLHEYVSVSRDQAVLATVNSELAIIEGKATNRSSVTTNTKKMLQEQIDATCMRKRKLVAEYKHLKLAVDQDKAHLASLLQFQTSKNKLERVVSESESLLSKAVNCADYAYLNQVYQAMKCTLVIVREDLATSSKFVQEQMAMLTNLHDDIESNLSSLQRNHRDYLAIEASLQELSHIYMKTFLNTIIALANAHIAEIFNYPISLVQFDTGHIDFNFPVTINETIPVKDISECSDAQRVIIELSMNLALSSIRELTDYPLLLDEPDRALDPVIRENLYSVLHKLVDHGIVSQIIMINHHTDFINTQFSNTIVLDSSNLKIPHIKSSGTKIEYY